MFTKDKLKEIILSQKDNLNLLNEGILRNEEIKISESFANIITGIRRCGKSTFLMQILNNQKISYYLNLEDPRLEGFELSDFNKIEELMYEIYGSKGVFFFDEIQNIPKWEKFIRYLIDKKQKVVLTGSNASMLSKELGTKLTGRHIQKEMFPFSFDEYLKLKKQKPNLKSFEDYFIKGGFPEYLKTQNSEILNQLLSDILYKDIVVRFNLKSNATLNKLALYLISNVGKEFSYNSIKTMFEIKSVQTVIDYIHYMENTYLIFTIPCFSYSYKKQQVSAKKVYSIDNGFSSVNSISFSKDQGRMLENMVFLHLRKTHKDIFYFKEKNECDFLIKENEKIMQAVQSCFKITDENKEREINGLVEALNQFKLKKGSIVTFDQEDLLKFEDKTIELIPIWKFLSL
ncbi:MAG: ATP-binding protein [Candidatus Nanoarchaeia archaeon]|nr:ATP-binding protein [Candidatus Nanoarchaeia archaeon]